MQLRGPNEKGWRADLRSSEKGEEALTELSQRSGRNSLGREKLVGER